MQEQKASNMSFWMIKQRLVKRESRFATKDIVYLCQYEIEDGKRRPRPPNCASRSLENACRLSTMCPANTSVQESGTVRDPEEEMLVARRWLPLLQTQPGDGGRRQSAVGSRSCPASAANMQTEIDRWVEGTLTEARVRNAQQCISTDKSSALAELKSIKLEDQDRAVRPGEAKKKKRSSNRWP